MPNTDGKLLYNFMKDVREKNKPRFRWLLKHDNFGGEGLSNLIHYVCEIGDAEFIKDLYDLGISITNKNDKEKTPLFTACEFGQADAVTELLRLMYLNIDKKNGTASTTIEATEKDKPIEKQKKDNENEVNDNLCTEKLNGRDVKSPLVSAEDDTIVEIVQGKQKKTLGQRLCACCYENDDVDDLTIRDTKHPLFTKDNKGRNCFYIAAANGHKKVVDILLNLEFCKLQPLLETSCTVIDKKSRQIYHDSPLRMLIRKMPDIAERVLDKYIDRRHESESIWICHYNLLDDTYLHGCNSQICHCQSQISAKTLAKENHPLMLAYKNGSIVGHHLVASLLYHKWRALRPIHFAMLAWYALFMAFITTYMLSAKKFQQIYVNIHNETSSSHDTERQYYLAVVLTGMSVTGVLVELVQLCLMRKLYLESSSHYFQNGLDWFMYITAVLVVLFPIEGLRTDTQWEIGSACLLASWFNFLLHHPGFSNYLHMIAEVFAELWRFTLVFSLVLLMFGFTFAVLNNNQLAYSTVFGAVIRTWTMMLGDISYGELFHSEEEGGETQYKTMTYIVFIIFILLGLIITNMWTGFIINRLSEVERTAITRKLHMQLDYILTVEQFLPFCLKRWFVFSKHQKQVKLGTGHHAIMLMTSMLLGDMRFSMPTVDALQHAEEVKQSKSKSDQAEDMIKNFQAMMAQLNNEEEITPDAAAPTEGSPPTAATLE